MIGFEVSTVAIFSFRDVQAKGVNHFPGNATIRMSYGRYQTDSRSSLFPKLRHHRVHAKTAPLGQIILPATGFLRCRPFPPEPHRFVADVYPGFGQQIPYMA